MTQFHRQFGDLGGGAFGDADLVPFADARRCGPGDPSDDAAADFGGRLGVDAGDFIQFANPLPDRNLTRLIHDRGIASTAQVRREVPSAPVPSSATPLTTRETCHDAR